MGNFGNSSLHCVSDTKMKEALRLCLNGGVEKWEDGKLWEDGKVGG